MADKSLYQLPSASDVGLTDLVYLEQVDEHAEEGFVTKNVQAAILGETIVSEFQYSSSGLVTEDKTIVGAINEIAEGGGSASAFDIEFTSSPSMSIDKTASEVDDAYTNGDLMRVHTDLGNWLALISYSEIDISGVLHHRYTFGNISGDGVTNFVMIDTAGSTIELTYGGSSLAQINDALTSSASTWSSSKIHTETEAVKDYTDDAIVSILPTETASGSVANFTTSLALPLVECKAQIVPTQSGSGDPSPSNVRPISGWTACKVTRTGANVWDEEWEAGYINTTSGQPMDDNVHIRTKNYIPVAPNVIYYNKGYTLNISQFRRDKSFIGSANIAQGTFTTQADCYFIKFFRTAQTYENDISINYPSTDTAYHAYNGTTVTIDLDGTIYGGELDVKRGVLKVAWFKFSGNDVTIVDRSGASEGLTTFSITLSNNDLPAGVANTVISSHFSRNIPSGTEGGTSQSATVIYFVVATDRLDADTAAGGLKWLQDNNVTFVYELATPIEVTLTPEEITTVGTNNVWADTGDIEVEFKVSIKDYIDSKLASLGTRSASLTKAASVEAEKITETETETEKEGGENER